MWFERFDHLGHALLMNGFASEGRINAPDQLLDLLFNAKYAQDQPPP